MDETEAYEKLQELRALASEIHQSGHYSTEELISELKQALGE